MITLKTLPDATAQQVFDQVAAHLLTQNVRSVANAVCAYQSLSGSKCAAGCLIGDDEYDPTWEGEGWPTLVERGIAPPTHSEMISRLQVIHDAHPPEYWREYLLDLSKDFDLEWNHE